jgi:hypothetical protein
MVVALMLTLSMSAFATDTVDLYIDGDYESTFIIGSNTTVYDIVSQLSTAVWSNEFNASSAYSPLCDTTSPLYGKYNMKTCFLTSLDGYASTGYIPATGALDTNNYYIPTQTVDPILQQADAALASYGGLMYWGSNGYGFSADYTHAVYIGWDWMFTVNGVMPGVALNPPSQTYGSQFLYTMRESLLSTYDRIDLDYQFSLLVFNIV